MGKRVEMVMLQSQPRTTLLDSSLVIFPTTAELEFQTLLLIVSLRINITKKNTGK